MRIIPSEYEQVFYAVYLGGFIRDKYEYRGGLLGSALAVRRLAPALLKRLLGVVLLIAAGKMIWS